ncbi:putative reverse transcriptase [Senna tora]|uniref:Putative reverse transcriptase n=1 Tax=Senna tora TaxID=362788 RepID=A0A835CHH4_9FABA|nr:putative reverse transcriptase [Senna tora]
MGFEISLFTGGYQQLGVLNGFEEVGDHLQEDVKGSSLRVNYGYPVVAWKDNLNLTTCGGVARDSEGWYLTGFVHKLGDKTILNAELWSMLSALEVAWCAGFKKVVIHHWDAFDWEIKFVHVHREGNFATDALAAYAFSRPLGLNTFDDASACLHQLLLVDTKGRGCLRLCDG